jgi:hypothetical protein
MKTKKCKCCGKKLKLELFELKPTMKRPNRRKRYCKSCDDLYKLSETTIDTYAERDFRLKQMGFVDYYEYLASDLWNRIRNAVFRLKGKICTLCPKAANIVHHRKYDYDTLRGDDLTYLVPLCNDCHTHIEMLRNGEKANHRIAELKYAKMMESKL